MRSEQNYHMLDTSCVRSSLKALPMSGRDEFHLHADVLINCSYHDIRLMLIAASILFPPGCCPRLSLLLLLLVMMPGRSTGLRVTGTRQCSRSSRQRAFLNSWQAPCTLQKRLGSVSTGVPQLIHTA